MRNNTDETIITVDGFAYHTDFTGFHLPMSARVANQPTVNFQPWQLDSHLQVLSACLVVSTNGLSLNQPAFSSRVLTANRVPNALHRHYAPLALWWSSGANTQAILIGVDSYQLGNMRAKLRPWRCDERLAALAECQQTSEQGTDFNVTAYLWAMLNACVVSMTTGQELNELDSASSSALLSAVIALNIRDTQSDNAYLLNSKAAAAMTLRLCRALGWTPTQIMATPAVEIDLILALLDRVESSHKTTSNTASVSGLAAHSDAIVIQVEDD